MDVPGASMSVLGLDSSLAVSETEIALRLEGGHDGSATGVTGTWMAAALSTDLPPGVAMPVPAPEGPLALWRSGSGRLAAFIMMLALVLVEPCVLLLPSRLCFSFEFASTGSAARMVTGGPGINGVVSRMAEVLRRT